MRRPVFVGCAAVLVGASCAAGTPISSGDATIDILNAPPALPIFYGNLGNGSLLTDAGAPDQLYMLNWYYRTPFDTTTRPFSNLVTPTVSVVGNTMTVTYVDNGSGPVGQNRFDAVFEITITDGATPGLTSVHTRLTFTARASNTATRTFQVFNITDLDLVGGASGDGFDDSISLTDAASRTATQSDGGGNVATISGTAANFSEVNTGITLRNRMASPGLNFTQAVGPVSGDAAVGYQWSVTLAPGQSQVIESNFQIGAPPAPACPGDVDGSDSTNISDFNILASHFGTAVPAGTQGDLTGNGFVDIADFNILAGDFGCGS